MAEEKQHPLAGRKQSKATIAKRKATMKAKREGRTQEGGRTEDAMIYLRKGVRWLDKAMAEGKIKERDVAHILLELALKTLRGEM